MSTMSDDSECMSRKIADAIRNLWFDPSVERAFQRDCRHNLNDSVNFFDSIDRIAQKTYIPTDQDVLQTYVMTTGITETTFLIGDLKYRMFDVGGQRSERKRWIHCF
ncbi:guanine nucleotide-binding protein subunit alpha, partial [Haplosporangium sp. Z 27]